MLKPFLKWAGGKSQIIDILFEKYPTKYNIEKYCEPFIGGGSLLFKFLNEYNLKEIYIGDTNKELLNCYIVIQNKVEDLINILKIYESEYINKNSDDRKKYYNLKRDRFNEKILSNSNMDIEKAALMIFLNKTCFNGLYRVNKKGFFNVPMGSYKNPKICDEENLKNISKKLEKVSINYGDYSKSFDFIDENTFVYFDPPYRPLTNTSSFTAYTENIFDDKEQIRLSEYFKKLDKKGAKLLLSNSDPKNVDENDNFFEDIYSGFKIERIKAKRMINSKGNNRGYINEILILNY